MIYWSSGPESLSQGARNECLNDWTLLIVFIFCKTEADADIQKRILNIIFPFTFMSQYMYDFYFIFIHLTVI